MNFQKRIMKVINDLLGYENLKIVQDTDLFSFSLDSVLLANFVNLNNNITKILDIGCGNAPIPLILSTKTDAKIIGVEIQKKSYDLALESIKINNLEKQIEVLNEDIVNIYKKYNTGYFDLITCNPPYFKYLETSNLNASEYKTIARHEISLNIEQVMNIAKYLLKNNSSIYLVHRPERISDIIISMRNNNIEPKIIQFVHPYISSGANIVLIEGVKNGKPGLKIKPPIISHKNNGEYSDEIKKIFINN